MLRGTLVELRPESRSDLENVYRWRNDPEVAYWATGSAPWFTNASFEQLNRDFSLNVEAPSRKKEYDLFSIYTLDGYHIGMADYREVDPRVRSAKIGLTIGEKEYWGKGYGTDAVRILIHYLFYTLNLERITLDTWSGNIRAIKSYQKNGFQVEGCLRKNEFVNGTYYDTIIMGLLREEYK